MIFMFRAAAASRHLHETGVRPLKVSERRYRLACKLTHDKNRDALDHL
jgi:hypothetical protein